MDYYSILHVPTNATQDEIKTAYKSLSLTFHPDKQSNKLKDQSTESFHMIDDAYTVLSNPDKRKAYDLLGESGVDLLEDNILFDETIEQYLARKAFFKYAQQMGTNNAVEFKLDLTTLTNPKLRRHLFTGMSITNKSYTPISDKTALILSSMVSSEEDSGVYGALVGILHHQYNQYISGRVSLRLSENFGYNLQTDFNPGSDILVKLQYDHYRLEGRNFTISTNKQITDSLFAEISFSLIKADIQFRIFYTIPKPVYTQTFDLSCGATSISLKYTNELIPDTSKLHVSGEIGLSDTNISTGYCHILNNDTKLAVHSVLSLTKGLIWKLKFQRGPCRYIIPIYYYTLPSLIDYGIYTIIPTALYMLYKYFIYPYYKDLKEVKTLRKQLQNEEEYSFRRIKANLQIEIMKNTAEMNKEKEKEINGLIIIEAYYYPKADTSRQSQFVQDVKMPLQYFVRDSQLKLYNGSKSNLLGFYKVDDVEMELFIRYEYNGNVYDLTVGDENAIAIPSYKAVKLGKSDIVS